jgi:hypothetical protein
MKKESKLKQKDESNLTSDDKAQILMDILQLSDSEIFQNEYSKLKESLEDLKNTSIKSTICSNFLFNKLEEIDKQIKLSDMLKMCDSVSPILQTFNFEDTLKTRKLILDLIKNINIAHENLCVHEERIYKLKIFYSEGSDNYPQHVQLKLPKGSDYNTFLRELKKELDIYEFAKFKVVLMIRDRDYKFLETLDDLDNNAEINLKIVPVSYSL